MQISRLMARPRPVPPYLRAVPPIACWKASKMICCFSAGMPIPVSVTANPMTERARPRVGCSGLQPAGGGEDAQRDRARLGELERVGEQVLQHLLQALGVGLHAAGQAGVDLDGEVQARADSATWRKFRSTYSVRSAKLRSPTSTETVPDSILREVEDVVDEDEQVVARAVDGARELDLPGGQVAVRVLGQLVGEDEQAVERRAQLVGHVGQELGLVLGGEGELLRLLLQRPPRLLDLAVLALDLLVLLGQQPRFLLQLLVGLLQLLLLALQLAGEALGLLQQLLGAAVGLDGVEHDPDRLRELLQEREVGLVEAVEGGQLHHRLHLALEDDGQHDDVQRRGLARARR